MSIWDGVKKELCNTMASISESSARVKEFKGESAWLERSNAKRWNRLAAGNDAASSSNNAAHARQSNHELAQQRQINQSLVESLSSLEMKLSEKIDADERREQTRIAEEKARWEASPGYCQVNVNLALLVAKYPYPTSRNQSLRTI